MNQTLLIRADASAEIGTGHVMRCLALGQAWRDHGGRVVFAMAESTAAVCVRIEAEGFGILSIPAAVGSPDDRKWLSRYGEEVRAKWLVLDGYWLGEEYQAAICGGPWKILCVDDEGLLAKCKSDLLLNQNLHASESTYIGAGAARLLLGPRYALLRSEFQSWRDRQRLAPPVAKSVLVVLGGSTQLDVARTVLQALALIRIAGISITFVVGGSGPAHDSLQQTTISSTATFVRNPPNMAELIANADIAISAAGAVVWELCFLGVPSVLIDLAPNQTPIAQALDRGRYAIHAGSSSDLSPERLARTVTDLILSREQRQGFSEHCQTLVDGRGAQRVVSAMFNVAQEERLSCSWAVRA